MKIGQPLTIQRTTPFYGVDPLTGLYLVSNHLNDPTSNAGEQDRTVFLNTSPDWYGGIQNSISYKGFSIDFLIQVTKQNASDVLQFGPRPGFFSATISPPLGNQPISVMGRWQKPGDITSYQRYTTTANTDGGDRAFRDASFVRMKNASVSYQLPATMIQKIKLEQLRLYANGQNLFTITRYQGLDPETQSISSLPPLRVITVGIQATF
jgi:TonB-dependent starch-binding outer membrane protein SusC